MRAADRMALSGAMALLLFMLRPIAWAEKMEGECPLAIPGGDEVVARDALTIVGEIHGTHEAQEALFALACWTDFVPVRIGLEVSSSEQTRLDQFFIDGDREALLAGPFWHRSLQDGRSSEAMLELLERVRQLRGRGRDINVFFFDGVPSAGRTRDGEMAFRIGNAIKETPKAKFLILVGNVHARTVVGVPWDPAYVPMGAYLAARFPLTSLNISYRGGTAWVCTGTPIDCGPHEVASHPDQGDERHVVLYPKPDQAGYDGELYVVELTAAPPAVQK